MADIAFLLVIYFMLTVTFSATQGLDLALPRDTQEPVTIEPIESVLVEVEGGGRLTVDGRAMGLDELVPYLGPRLQRNPNKPVIVRPAPDARYGAAVDVFDELREAKVGMGLDQEVQIALPTAREAALSPASS